MKDTPTISQESLNAFLDGELAAHERSQILTIIQHDKALAQELCELRQTKELLALAYQDPPQPPTQKTRAAILSPQRTRRGIAATLLLGLGLGIGWFTHLNMTVATSPSLQNIAQLDISNADNSKILLHISTMDVSRVKAALDTTEELLNNPRGKKPFQLEVLANADGLGLLREGSPYAKRIHDIAREHGNVSFKACGFAMEHSRLKEGNEVKLIPEAQRVDAGLEQILRRLKDGWMYVRA